MNLVDTVRELSTPGIFAGLTYAVLSFMPAVASAPTIDSYAFYVEAKKEAAAFLPEKEKYAEISDLMQRRIKASHFPAREGDGEGFIPGKINTYTIWKDTEYGELKAELTLGSAKGDRIVYTLFVPEAKSDKFEKVSGYKMFLFGDKVISFVTTPSRDEILYSKEKGMNPEEKKILGIIKEEILGVLRNI